MKSYQEFCAHYNYDMSSTEAKKLYQEYKENFAILEAMSKTE